MRKIECDVCGANIYKVRYEDPMPKAKVWRVADISLELCDECRGKIEKKIKTHVIKIEKIITDFVNTAYVPTTK